MSTVEDQINSMVASGSDVRVNTAEGSTESLRTPATQRVDTAGVPSAPIPNAEEFADQLKGHVSRANEILAKLNEQRFDPTSGALLGPAVEGEARDRLQAELKLAESWLAYTDGRARQMLPQRAAQQAAVSEANAESLQAAAKREAAIQTLSTQRVDGKELGRLAAAEMYDRAAAESLAAKLARG